MILTNELLLAARSDNGGWNSSQIKLLGINGFQKGWRKRVTGSDIDEGVYAEMLRIRNAHLRNAGVDAKPVSLSDNDRWVSETRANLLSKKNEAESHVDRLLRQSSFIYAREEPIQVGGNRWFIDFHIRRVRIGKNRPRIGVALEIDGGYHFSPEQQELDEGRTKTFCAQGLSMPWFAISAENAMKMDMHTLSGVVINPVSYGTVRLY